MEPPRKPVSLQDIAQRLGLSRTAVSKALRGAEDIAPATRRKVRDLARQMGYQPSTAMSAAMRAAGSRGRQPYRETIACVTQGIALNLLGEDPATQSPQMGEFRRGLIQHAADRGCDLDFLSLREHPTAAALSRVLKARGIRRVLCILGVLPHPNQQIFQEIAEDFSLTFLGFPEIHRCPGALVHLDYYAAGRRAFLEGWRAGYRRFVLLGPLRILNNDGRFEAGFRHAAQQALENAPVKVRTSDHRDSPLIDEFLYDRSGEPLCLVGGERHPYYPHVMQFLEDHPQFGWIDWHANIYPDFPLTGIDQGDLHQARAALDVCLQTEPRSAAVASGPGSTIHLVEPRWRQGTTLRQQRTNHLNLGEHWPFAETVGSRFISLPLPTPRATSPRKERNPQAWQPLIPPPAIPAGRWLFHGIPFLIPPDLPVFPPAPIVLSAETGRSRRAGSREIRIPVAQQAKALYLLHACAEQTQAVHLVDLSIEMADGTTCTHAITSTSIQRSRAQTPDHRQKPSADLPGSQIMDWWPLNPHFHTPNARYIRIMDLGDLHGRQGCYYVMQWLNPTPAKHIRHLILRRIESTPGIYMLFAITLAGPQT